MLKNILSNTRVISPAIGIGSPLLDFLVYVDDGFLARVDLQKGRMHPISIEESDAYVALLAAYEVKKMPGGSAANALAGISALGGRAAFLGKIGNDPHGDLYEELTAEDEVHGFLSRNHAAHTGHAFTFVTPDSERTFASHLGAAVTFCAEDVLHDEIKKSFFLHLEGYQLEGEVTHGALREALRTARKEGVRISIDLSDAGTVARARPLLDALLADRVTIVFASEEEAASYATGDAEDALSLLGKHADIVALKKGAKGSVLFSEGTRMDIAPFPADTKNTTGAGDAYAAGMLWALAENMPLALAGKIASFCGARVVAQSRARLTKDIRKDIINLIQKYGGK